MDTLKFKTLVVRVEDAHASYLSSKSNLEDYLHKFVRFEFSIEYLYGDGLVLLDVDTARVASINACLSFIQRNKVLTQEGMKTISI